MYKSLINNEDYSFDAYEALMPQNYYMEKKLKKTLQKLIEVEKKNHKAIDAKFDKMKTEFDAK